ncbi:hypothetical protein P5673_031566 [Acropora cervicornis]|uniref:Uncharacterized protein n=1 Tax=Acropora cervicornis TaxID=6130 RepID=A0AAD9PSK1_ACRCE|nr:hypothetical protein P5673_031566 [Acropora cervicornis]
MFTMKNTAFTFMLLVLVFVNVILESEGWVGPIPGSQSNGGKKKARFLRAASNTICPLAKSLGCEGLRQKINEESWKQQQ